MYKNGLKNFFKNLLYVFVPMGTVYFILIFIIYGAVVNLFQNASVMLNDIISLVDKSISGSQSTIQDFIDYSISKIDWNQNIFDIIGEIINTKWIQNTVTGFLQTLDLSVEGFTGEFTQILNNFTESVKVLIVVAVVMLFIGIFVANSVTGLLIRRKTIKRNVKQFFLHRLLEPFITAIFAIALVLLSAVIKGYTIILLVVYAIVYEIMTMLFAWLLHRNKTMKLQDVITARNVGLNIAVAITIIAIDIALFILLYLINAFAAILIIVPALIYSFNIIKNNAESYIKSLIEKNVHPQLF